MKRLYKAFLEDNIPLEFSNEKFDYDFSKNCTDEKFNEEYKKFLNIYNSVFYLKNRLVTIFNSYEIRIKKKDLIYLFELYIYSMNKFKYQKIILEEFLVTYYNTISTKEYRENYKKYNDSKKDFNETLKMFNLKKQFFVLCIRLVVLMIISISYINVKRKSSIINIFYSNVTFLLNCII